MSLKKEFGDFQTPEYLAEKVVTLVNSIFGKPELVVEPTAGLGSFIKASVDCWGNDCQYEGYEVNKEYVEQASKTLNATPAKILHRNFFSEDWKKNLSKTNAKKILVVGNPPWVTNSELGSLGSQNLPQKSNFQGLRGFDAKTGKANFDIAEWMLIKLIEALPKQGAIAMLCKTATARKVLKHFWKTEGGREGSCIFRFDAKATFDVAVDACLLMVTGQVSQNKTATIYKELSISADSTQFGFVDGDLVSDIEAYNGQRDLDGGTSAYQWRSGIKHDASKVMELTYNGSCYQNGLGELVELEDNYIYPLLKSSDIGNRRVEPRKYVLIPQKHTGDETSTISTVAPKTWAYLNDHAETLDNRRSSIYRNRPQFAIFGIGRYSFAPWKVAVSGMYKSFAFVVIPPFKNCPVMIDDTCYSIPCNTEKEATLLCNLLSSKLAKEFLQSLVFMDSKRPITIDVLRRISISSIAKKTGKLNQLESCINSGITYEGTEKQMLLAMEKQKKYQTSKLNRT